jgi:hypothetical protein
VHQDALTAKLAAAIDDESDDKAALSPEARQKAESEVLGDLLAVERDECALVWRAQTEGLPVERRGDVSPLALLGLQLVNRPDGGSMKTSMELVRRVLSPGWAPRARRRPSRGS